MGKEWDNKIPGVDIWKEALRICKPGSMLAAFGGSRTHHHLMIALEQAGWEIRDVIMWIYASGFPKSLNIGKHVPRFEGYKTCLKPAYEPIILCMKPLDGTYAENALKWGVGGMNVESARIGNETIKTCGGNKFPGLYGEFNECRESNHQGRYPSSVLLDESAAEMLDQQSGNNASRFFYCPKASASERNKGLDNMPSQPSTCNLRSAGGLSKPRKEFLTKNSHPCVKPLALMRYLIKLLAPPGNPVCLDPFCGSGTTMLACKELGIDCIGIEREAEYCEIIRKRLSIT